MALLLSCENISRSFGPRPLFQGITLHFEDNQRTGLIGPNGAGKSTLLKILAGVESMDTGQLSMKRQLRLGYLPQEDFFREDATVENILVEALTALHPATAGHDPEHDLYEHQIEAGMMLSKMGFSDNDQKVSSLSGGWKKRLAIAKQLVRKPDLLLLDEPTNHLDVDGILWLEKLLLDAPFGFLLVSHDRYFLEDVTNRIIEINSSYSGGFFSHNGKYSDFLTKRQEYLEAQASYEKSLAGRVRREMEWLARGAKARGTKAKGRIEEANRLIGELGDVRARNATKTAAEIDFNSSQRQTRKLIAAKNVAKVMGDRTLFADVNFVLSPKSRLGLLGPNGSGKSTMIKLLTGQLKPDSGEIVAADGLKVVVFDQNRDSLDPNQTVRRAISPGGDSLVYRGQTLHVSGWAQMFNFHTSQLDLLVGELSGGEQARILIARLMMQPADVLILDEPTNDLDIPTLEVLEESLEEFPGALVLVTHDRFMLDRISTQLLSINGDGTATMHVDLVQWEQAREDARTQARDQARADAKSQGSNKNKKVANANSSTSSNATSTATSETAKSKTPPGLKRLTYMEQREWEQMEQKIMQAENDVETRQAAMDDPAIAKDHLKLSQACKDFENAQHAVQKLYARWEYLDAKQK